MVYNDVVDPEHPSEDIYSGGTIVLVDPGKSLESGLPGRSKMASPSVYAEAGIWYDALQSLSDLIQANPGDKVLRETRADLLEQVGLHEVAEYDKGR